MDSLTVDGCPIDDLELDFVLPGYPEIELKKGGRNISVTLDNLEEYVQVCFALSLTCAYPLYRLVSQVILSNFSQLLYVVLLRTCDQGFLQGLWFFMHDVKVNLEVS